MKNDLQIFRARNIMRAAVWFVVLLIYSYCVYASVTDKFLTQGEVVSVRQYNLSIFGMCMIAVLVSALWWGCATFFTGVGRRAIEEYSFLISLFCIIFVIGAATVIFFFNHSIMDNNGQMHTVQFVFAFPVLFGCLMYCLPPVNLEKVIWPFGPRSIAWVISVGILLGTVYMLFLS